MQKNKLTILKEQLNDGEKDALTFLENSITPNPYNPDEHHVKIQTQKNLEKFILNLNIDGLKKAIAGIVLTLNAKSGLENALADYTGSDKDTLTQILKDATTNYINHLKSMCDTKDFDEINSNLSSQTNNSAQFEDIINTIKYYNKITKQLNDKERNALTFLENSITTPNLSDRNFITHTKENFFKFILNLNIDELKKAIADIALTLNAKSKAEKALANYTWPAKDELTQKLKDATTNYINHLKIICNTQSTDIMSNNLSSQTNNSAQFEDIINTIKDYNKITEQLNDNEKDALIFLESSITKPNPDKPKDTAPTNLTIQTKTNFHLFILNINTDRLKKAISGIVLTLNAKIVAEKGLANYTGPAKNTLAQILKDATTNYINHLKSMCDTHSNSVNAMYSNLSSQTNNSDQFEDIINNIKHYNKITKQLNYNEKDALTFLENSITTPNPNDPDDHNLITHSKQNFLKLILNLDIDELKKSISGIVLTLNAKIVAEKELANYTEPTKNMLMQRLEDATTNYTNHLKVICNTQSPDVISNNLSSQTNNSAQFEDITNNIKDYNKVTSRLNRDFKNALTFLENSIIQYNPYEPEDPNITIQIQESFSQFILSLNTEKLKKALIGILLTLYAKKGLEDDLANYTGPAKNTLAQISKNATTNYINHLKILCNTQDFDEMYNNLLSQTYNTSQFKDITDNIKHYNKITKQLNDAEKDALDFIEYSITKPNPNNTYDPDTHNLMNNAQANFNRFILNLDIDKIKKAISDTVLTVNTKKVAENALADYTGSDKDTLTQILKDATTNYINHLKSIFNTKDFDEINGNLSSQTYNTSLFEGIINNIKHYNSNIEQLNDDEKDALTFLENSITTPNPYNPEDPDTHNLINNAQGNFNRFILNLDIDKIKKALAIIILTLKKKKVAEDTLITYTGADKNILTQMLKDEETKYIENLKSICNARSINEMYHNLLLEKDDKYLFENIVHTINRFYSTYNSIIKQLNDNERDALDFIEYSIKKPTPNDPYDLAMIRAHSKQVFNRFILHLDIDTIKKALESIILILNAKKIAENAIITYTGLAKHKLTQILKDEEAKYIKHLKKMCDTTSANKTYSNLSSQTYNSAQFENITNIIKDYDTIYNGITNDLNDDEKKALYFLENLITNPNPDDPEDHNITINAQVNFNRFILDSNTEKLKKALAGIVLTLNAKIIAEDTLAKYTKIAKNTLEHMLKDEETKYIKHLKSICDTYSTDEMHSNLSSKTNNSAQFENITNTIKYYNNITGQLNDDYKDALDFLENSITTPNPDDPEDHNLITHSKQNFFNRLVPHIFTDIKTLKKALENIVSTSKPRKIAEKDLANYTGPAKNTLAQILKDAETNYIKRLKSICNTYNFYMMYYYLSERRTDDHTSQFEGIINAINHYNNVTGQLNDNERNALDFLENSITTPNPDDPDDHNLITHSKQIFNRFMLRLDINNLKKILSDIVLTLNAKRVTEDALTNHTGPDKDTLTQKLKDAETNYIKHLKRICNTTSVDEMCNHLPKTTNNSAQFVIIVMHINYYNKTYNKLTKLLNDTEKDALDFLENSITTPNLDDPYDHNFITHSKQNFNQFILLLGINNLKKSLLDIILTLNAKKITKNALINYTGPDKTTLIQKFKDMEIEHITYLKRFCNTTSVDEIYSNLARKTAYKAQFEKIANTIKDYYDAYNKVKEQLNDDEKNALDFLESSITKPNPDNPEDHNITTNAQAKLAQFILDTNIDKLKKILSNIVIILKKKQATADALANYVGREKNLFTHRFYIITTDYIKHLKSICNTTSVDEVYSNLSSPTNTSALFEGIVNDITLQFSLYEHTR
ncbi:BTA121 domain-containing protein surface lipoprotein [Borrelia hermsii]|uniref:Uncharacterized protein n=2 Tax=Borrelia hermsii TaxID=140 RepID=S4VN29_BORHE|nr:hypothetical protein [Borrelia hermsii]AGO68856.1 hypothetical protein BHA167 [Borrelia hermsii]AMR75999.1 hypothetical protein A0V01_05140 [Borrelia hermsii]ANA43804.1 Mrl-type protein [Borrelia hermsii HS1]UPA08598.1 hypothetical protein bhDAH_001311 [Borrelia hermsii DAH]